LHSRFPAAMSSSISTFIPAVNISCHPSVIFSGNDGEYGEYGEYGDFKTLK
jgi:hypothetical protein